MSKKCPAVTKTHSSHNYLNTQKSNAHTKVNGSLVQLWFGSASQTAVTSADMINVSLDKETSSKNVIFARKAPNKIFKHVLMGGLLLGGVSNAYAAPQIPASNGGARCSACAPPGWEVDLGTPDISDKNRAANIGTGGGDSPWYAAPLPLPPNEHTTWISLRDLGDIGNEEIVSTDMTGLIPGYSYEVSLYTLTRL